MNQIKKNDKTSNNLIRIMLVFMSLVPFFEINIVRKIFTFNVGVYVLPIVWVMLFLVVLLLAVWQIKRVNIFKAPTYTKNIIIITVILFFISLIRNLSAIDSKTGFVHIAYFFLPILYAVILSSILIKTDKDNDKTLLTFIYLFATYVVLNIIINIIFYDYSFFDASKMDRLISPGGGPVIFGYSIALVYSVLFYIRKKISVKKYVILAIILIIGAFFTKSRGAMWSVTILTFISIIANKNSRTNILIFSAALVLVPILYLMIQDFVPRFFLFEDSSRTNTLINSFKIFSKYDLVEILTGKGLGQLFQYNQYIENRTLGWTLNLFNYQGYELLVQPHNTWLYILMEQGFAGLVLMTFVIFVIPFFLNKNTDRRIEMFVFIGTFLFLNIFDSILMIDPGSSAMWWFILIMVVTNLEVKTDVFKSSFFEDKNHDLKGLCDVSVIVEPK